MKDQPINIVDMLFYSPWDKLNQKCMYLQKIDNVLMSHPSFYCCGMGESLPGAY